MAAGAKTGAVQPCLPVSVADPASNFVVIMKDGKIFRLLKN